MNLLTLKHWELFGLMFGVMIATLFLGLANSQTAWTISLILLYAISYSWLWTMAANLYPKLPPNTNLSLNKFKIFLLIPAIYIAIMSMAFGGISIGMQGDSSGGNALAIVPIHLFSIFCIFWCLRFVAKSLKAVESQGQVSFSDYAREFILIWFFPIGVWIIQPRINRIFSNQPENLNQ